MRRTHELTFGSTIALGLLLASGNARADTASSCNAAFESGQELEQSLKLRAARDAFVQCAKPTCHALIRKDCASHLETVTRNLPTVTLGATDRSGKDLPDVTTFVDGAEIDASRTGAATAVDPGEHVVRFEYRGERLEQTVTTRAGEKNRHVTVTFGVRDDSESSIDANPYPVAPALPAHWKEPKRPSSVPVIALVGASALSFGGFAFFAISGLQSKNELAATCGAQCNQQQVSVVSDRYLAADVLLVAGVLTAGLAAYLHFTNGKAPPVPRNATAAAK